MKDLGDDMAGATGWRSERGYETLGDITGATEDWNYFAQGSYGYTPEVRGLNFHANYPDSVIEEYLGDAAHPGQGAREAYLIAGERAADRAEHSVIEGVGARAATLRLRKEFDAPLHPKQGADASFADELDTTLAVGDGGTYEWDVMPSGRPFAEGETWTMTCELPGRRLSRPRFSSLEARAPRSIGTTIAPPAPGRILRLPRGRRNDCRQPRRRPWRDKAPGYAGRRHCTRHGAAMMRLSPTPATTPSVAAGRRRTHRAARGRISCEAARARTAARGARPSEVRSCRATTPSSLPKTEPEAIRRPCRRSRSRPPH